MDEKELYWLAGLLEGEGSFFLYQKKIPAISLMMTDEDIVKKISLIFEVSYCQVKAARYKENNWKTPYKLLFRGKRALNWMEKLYPLMGTRRREQIDKVISSSTPVEGVRKGNRHASG